MTQSAQPASPFGVDFWIGPNATGQLDADPSMRTTSGRQLLSQSLLCRLSTPRGSVIDCPNDCMDMRDYVSAGMTANEIAQFTSAVQLEVLKDQRILAATVTATFVPANGYLQVSIAGQSSYGPFSLVLAVSNVSVTILNANLLAGSGTNT